MPCGLKLRLRLHLRCLSPRDKTGRLQFQSKLLDSFIPDYILFLNVLNNWLIYT